MKTGHEIRVHIEEMPQFDEGRLYIFNEYAHYTIVDGIITQNQREDGVEFPPTMEGPPSVLNAIAEGMAMYLEKRGGITTDQLNKGKISRLTDEVTWMRGIIEKQLK